MKAKTCSVVLLGFLCLLPFHAAIAQTVGHWQQVPSQSVPSFNTILNGAAATDQAAVVVGYAKDPNTPTQRTLAEVCSSTSCLIAGTPNMSVNQNQLNAVTAIPGSAGSYVAVGSYDSTDAAASGALAMKSTDGGNSWSMIQIPFDGKSVDQLFGVSAADPGHIWMVGFHQGPPVTTTQKVGHKIITTTTTPPIQVLLFLYDGNTVTRIASPTDSSATNNQLFGISCSTSGACWTVGITGNGQFTPLALKLTPGTTTWTVVPPVTPTSSTDSEEFRGVSVGASGVCAVGFTKTSLGNEFPIIECIDGSGQFQKLGFAYASSTTNSISTRLYGIAQGNGFFQAVGDKTGTPFVLQGTTTAAGSVWHEIPVPTSGLSNSFFGIGASDANHMFASGQSVDSSGNATSFVERFTNP